MCAVIVRFVDIGRIVDHSDLNFLYIEVGIEVTKLVQCDNYICKH